MAFDRSADSQPGPPPSFSLRPAVDVYDAVANPPGKLPAWIEPAVVVKSGKTLLGGAAAIGKSLVHAAFLRALGTGEALFKHPDFTVPELPRVLMLEKEVGEWSTRNRVHHMFTLEEAELMTKRCYFVGGARGLYLDTPAGLRELKMYIREYEPRVVQIDPASKFLIGDDSDNKDVAKFFAALDEVIDDFRAWGLSIVLSHHFRKPSTSVDAKGNLVGDPLDFYNMRGGSKWIDDPDTRISLHKPGKDRQDGRFGPGSWLLHARFLFRHAAEMPNDYVLAMNENDTLQVRMAGKLKAKDQDPIIKRTTPPDTGWQRPPSWKEQQAMKQQTFSAPGGPLDDKD